MPPPARTSILIDAAAARLKVSRRTVYNYIKAGLLQTIKTPLGTQRVLVDSIEECLVYHRHHARYQTSSTE